MLEVIEIENIKGISHQRFELDILPNKPSLLVAPNGFGKSSFATAFNSMNNTRISLNKDDLYSENPANLPRIYIKYKKPNGTSQDLEATNTTNTISNEFAYFVINNLTRPKGIGSQYGNATATLEIKDVVLVDSIPKNISFNYSFRESQERFGANCRVLPNVKTVVLSNLKLVERLSENYSTMERANGKRVQKGINTIIDKINLQQGTADNLTDWIDNNLLNDFKQIDYLKKIGDIINEYDIGFNSETKSYLAAIQLIWLYNTNPTGFKNACTYNNYKLDKQQFDETLKTFNCTWKNIRSTETNGKLVVKFPKAIHISNGQRDILCFISMLFRAKRNLKKQANILIIDEVFDYLDDANLTAAQFYISTFIKEFKELNREIYPLILTHLNPEYFKNFTFSDQKVYYLDKSTAQVNHNMVKLLRYRDKKNDSIADDISQYLLHFNPNTINRRVEFKDLTIRELWGEGKNFIDHLYSEVTKYLENKPYDPFAVCGGVRVKIEEIAYNKLLSDDAKNEFLTTKKTRCKLEKAQEMGIVSPESHYLLGIIYNEGMHWKDNQDNISPIASKLENLTIKKLIKDVFSLVPRSY
ncbi:hypothetical protein [Planktothrix agardhii]|uniref:hypothetical protein n=1 Tax=Planktothrix agardhii TaxID=1160 RepID=UPI0020A7BD0F|nr:hypothetical protein [Planktothrix agardhii]CAD5937167.1 hypothetical protein NO758_01663 [Planktothrix agardhii]